MRQLRNLRAETEDLGEYKGMKQRIITAAILIVILFAALFFYYTPVFNVIVSIICMMATYEILHAYGLLKNIPLSIVNFAFSALVPFFMMQGLSHYVMPITFVYVIAQFIVVIADSKRVMVSQVATMFFTTFVTSFAFSTIAYMKVVHPQHSMFYCFIMFIAAWITDSGAYFTGRLLGKHKMAPYISPHKTWEGAVGGVLASTIGAVIAGLVYQAICSSSGTMVEIDFLLLALTGCAASIIGELGDLSASCIKRQCNIKDFGSIMPGHGGILDRFDSLMFVAPFVFLVVKYFPIAG